MFSEKENVLHAGPQMQPGRSAGLGKLAPKTPSVAPLGMKTPFRIPLGGENGDTLKKGLTTKKSIFQLDASKFATPVGPRRVPLGGKTTNARARNSSGKGKVKDQLKESKVESPLAKIIGDGDEYPEPEYMPPRAIDLPDLPDDYIQLNYDLIKQNLFTGCCSAYLDGIDESGMTKAEREMNARLKESEREMIAEADIVLDPTTMKPIGQKKPALGAKFKGPVMTKSRVPPFSTGNTSQSASRSTSRTGNTTTSSRPASRVGRQTSSGSTYNKSTTSNTQRSKTPTINNKPTTLTHKRTASNAPPLSRSQTFSASSRPTTSGTTTRSTSAAPSRPHSRALSTTSNSGSRPTTARSSSSNSEARHAARLANSLTSIGYTSGRSISGGMPKKSPTATTNTTAASPCVKLPQVPPTLQKTVHDIEEEALAEMALLSIYKDSSGENRDEEGENKGSSKEGEDEQEEEDGAGNYVDLGDDDLEFQLSFD